MTSIVTYLDHLECPFRSSFKGEPVLDINHVKVACLADAAKYYLYRCERGKSTSLSDLRDRFGQSWAKMKELHSFKYDWKNIVYTPTKLKGILELIGRGDDVVAVNFPLRLVLNTDEVITGKSEAIILKNRSSSRRYLQLLSFDYTSFATPSCKMPGLRLKAGFTDLAIRDVELSRLPRRYKVFCPRLGNVLTVNVSPYSDRHTINLLKSIYRQRSDGLLLPTVNDSACRSCLYRTTCEWEHG